MPSLELPVISPLDGKCADMRNRETLLALFLIALVALFGCSDSTDDSNDPTDPGGGGDDPPVTVDGTKADAACVAQFDLIPADVIESVTGLRLYYGHTSHGSQLMTGLAMLESADATYDQPHAHEPGGDLGHNGDLAWEVRTRAYLADLADETDVVIWSWCGGASDNTPEGIDTYLHAMNQLEVDYPGIVFVYMTGHLDGSGPSGNLYANNNRIRAYCDAHEKWLFDFADIESYDPDGNYFPDESDGCGWCVDWCAESDCPDCGSCAHSHCFNCWQKGKAFWWLLGRIVGWEG